MGKSKKGTLYLAPMKIDPYLTDESTITPPTPAAALFRLKQLEGSLRRNLDKANLVPINGQDLALAVDSLQEAVSNGDLLGTAFKNAQKSIQDVYNAVITSTLEADAKNELVVALGFPDLNRTDQTWVQQVDVASVVATHFKPKKQVFTTLAFNEAHGATAYWLHEIRVVDGDDIMDAILENWAPVFPRVRMPVGKHRLVIESRNTSYAVMSEEFELEVPAL
jgi:hypothetical protein